MFIAVKNKPLGTQSKSNSCWISVAHYVLSYTNTPADLGELEREFYRPDLTSGLIQTGSGSPKIILENKAVGYKVNLRRTTGSGDVQNNDQAYVNEIQFLDIVRKSIGRGIPVCATLKATDKQNGGQDNMPWSHIVAIISVSLASGTLAYKDPMPRSSPEKFGTDFRTVHSSQFLNSFPYRRASLQTKYDRDNNLDNANGFNFTARCSHITFLSPSS